jgi:hypothetical protein
MSKPTIVKLSIGGMLAIFAGLLIAIIAALGILSGTDLVMRGPDVVGMRPSPAGAAFIGLTVLGTFAMIGGAVAGLVAWIGALLNTVQLDDKAWFVLLLVLGLLSFGFVAMVAYVIAGPDSTHTPTRHGAATA